MVTQGCVKQPLNFAFKEDKYMNNETIMNFDIKIKLRGDNVYDLYFNGEHLTSLGSYEAILDEVKKAIRYELLMEK